MQSNNLGSTNKDGVYFTVTAMAIDDNRTLGKAIRDKDGYFTGVPVAVLGTVTRNATQYDTPSFVAQLKGPDTTIARRISEGTLFGEYGHPFIDLNSQQGMARLLHLEPQKESHHIRSISIKHVDDLGLDLVTVDTKGTGPYGQYFDNGMEDPTMNVAFSLRGISKAKYNPTTRVTFKELVSLVTFDAGMSSGGFKEASKRYMAAKEDFSFESMEILNQQIHPEDLMLVRSVAVESFSKTELNDLMRASKVVIGTVEIGYIDPNTKTIFNQESNEHRSLFHSFSKIKGRE